MVAAGSSQLAKLQSALAALLMEPGRLEAFQNDPKAYARRFGLTGDTAALLAGLPPEGAAYFASRRVIDRFSYLSGDLPRSVAAVDHAVGLAATYFADKPYAFEDPRDEVRQFRAWALAAAKKGTLPAPVADLVAIEAGGMLLMDKAYAKPAKSKTVKRASGMALLALRHDPEELLHGDTLAAPRGNFPTVLAREEDDIEVYKLEPVAIALFKAATGRLGDDAVVAKLASKFTAKAVRASLRDLRKLGILCPNSRPSAARPKRAGPAPLSAAF